MEDETGEDFTIDEYLKKYGFSEEMKNLYLVPMSSAVGAPKRWINFYKNTHPLFYNHGFLCFKHNTSGKQSLVVQNIIEID